MQTLGSRARIVVVSSMAVAWAFLAYACTSADENPASVRTHTDAGDGGTVDPQSTPDGSLGAPICGAYGGYDNVKVIAAAVLAKVSADCRIGSVMTPIPQHLTECFEIQMGSAFQCPGVTYVSGATKDSKGKSCRDMTSAHQGLSLRKADFDAFRDDLAAALGENKLTPADVKSIAAFVEGTRNLVTQNLTQPNKNTHCACSDPLPGQYMGVSCLPDSGIVDSGSDSADSGDD